MLGALWTGPLALCDRDRREKRHARSVFLFLKHPKMSAFRSDDAPEGWVLWPSDGLSTDHLPGPGTFLGTWTTIPGPTAVLTGCSAQADPAGLALDRQIWHVLTAVNRANCLVLRFACLEKRECGFSNFSPIPTGYLLTSLWAQFLKLLILS